MSNLMLFPKLFTHVFWNIRHTWHADHIFLVESNITSKTLLQTLMPHLVTRML